jgi:hypothetical protein
VSLAFYAAAFAGNHNVPPDEPIASVSIPDKWDTKEVGERVEAVSPEAAVRFVIIPVERGKTAETVGELMRYIRNRDGVVVDANSRRSDSGKLNAADVRYISWQGKAQAGKIDIKFVILTIAENQPLVAVYWGTSDAVEKYRGPLDRILGSVREK